MILATILCLSQALSPEQEIAAQYKRWDAAIVKRDESVLNDILADSFESLNKKLKKTKDKKQFIEGIAKKWKGDGPHEKSFTTKIVSVSHKEETYFAKVKETIVFEPVNGKSEKIEFMSLDTWQVYGDKWRITRTQPGE